MYSHQRNLPFNRMNWFFLFALTLFLSFFTACHSKKKLVTIDPAFSKYIEAYTSGVISKKNTIRVQLASDAPATHSLHETLKEELFSFSPSVEGKAYWVDARTIEFKPDNDLKPDELYEISFKLGNILSVPSTFKTFKFNIQVITPSYEVEENGLRGISKDSMSLSGQIITADVESSDAVEKILSANLNGNNLSVKWQHNEVNKMHSYIIGGIHRSSSAGKLVLEWDGAPLHASVKGNKEISVPAIGDFKVMDVKTVQAEEQ